MKNKIKILFLFLCLFSLKAKAQDNEIYKLVFKEFVLKNTQKGIDENSITFIVTEPIYYIPQDFEIFKDEYRKLDKKTFVDFIKQASNPVKEDFNFIDNEVIFVTRKLIDEKEFILKYPNWELSILEFSNIGYNQNKTQALVYFGCTKASTGGGIYLLLEKSRKKWKIKKSIPVWAA